MAADNRLSPAVLDQIWLLTTSHIFTIKWFKMVFHLIDFILIYVIKNSHSKGKWPVLLAFLYFWGPVLHIHVDSSVFSCMDTSNVAFKFSAYLLPIVVHELLSNIDFTLPFFSFNPHNLGRLLVIPDDFATIPFHLVLFSTALLELAKSIPVHSLILSLSLFSLLPLLLFPFIVLYRIVFAKPEDLLT